jgi:hypothetical protein
MLQNDVAGQLTRRRALKLLMGSAGAAAGLPAIGKGAPPSGSTLCLIKPAGSTTGVQAHALKFFSQAQLNQIAALAETIIPTDDHSPGARAARTHEFIDDIVAISDQKTKDLWSQGLAALEKMVRSEYGKNFEDCDAVQRIAMLENLAVNEEHPETLEEKFFVAAKRATVDGYYTSAIGIHQDLQYQGNTALAEFPGCTHEEHQALD